MTTEYFVPQSWSRIDSIRGFLVLCCIFLGTILHAQTDSIPQFEGYPAVNEYKLINSKWKYTYSTHAESNTVIHKADKVYAYFLYLKYDFTYQNYLNGRMTQGRWQLNPAKNELLYNHRNVKWWRIAEFSDDVLVLEFTLNRKSSYRYHFVRVESDEAPFVRAANELPEVDLLALNDDNKRPSRKKRRGLFQRKNKKKKNKKRKPKKDPYAPPPTFIKIELVGGGFFGGPDPIYRDYTVIKTNGRVIKEMETEKRGLIKSKNNISREQLEELIKFIEDKKFFEFSTVYACTNNVCERRSRESPRPVPLRLAVTHGSKRKVITVTIYGGDESRSSYVNYPAELDLIIDAIRKMEKV